MDDRNIVRAVLFSAAIQVTLKTHERFGKVPGLSITKKEFEQHIIKEAGDCTPYQVSQDEYLQNFPAFSACLTLKRREKELAKI